MLSETDHLYLALDSVTNLWTSIQYLVKEVTLNHFKCLTMVKKLHIVLPAEVPGIANFKNNIIYQSQCGQCGQLWWWHKARLKSTSYPPPPFPDLPWSTNCRKLKLEAPPPAPFFFSLTPHRRASLQFVEFLKMFRLLGWKENHRKITIRAALHF